MFNDSLESILAQPYDCLVLANPQIQILDEISERIQSLGIKHLNVSKELSANLLTIAADTRSRFSQNWLLEAVASFQNSPLLCTYLDLMFDPSFTIDPFSIFRQAARTKQIIVLWPGEYVNNMLSYAIPEHHHYRTWKITESLTRQPLILIHQIPTAQGV